MPIRLNIREYIRARRAFNATANPESTKVAKKMKKEEKKLLKKMAKNTTNRVVAVGYEKACKAFNITPNPMVMAVAKQLDAQETAAKIKWSDAGADYNWQISIWNILIIFHANICVYNWKVVAK